MPSPPFDALDPSPYRLPPGLETQLHSPALVIFMDQVRRNLRSMLGYLGTANRWRPHLKTTKMPAIWRELVQLGVRHFKCATLREARCLAAMLKRMKVEDADLLVAYPLVGPALGGLERLARENPGIRFSVLVESEQACAQIDPHLDLFIDLNPGMQRTGMPMQDTARILAVARAAGDRLAGLHYYDGHLHDPDPVKRRAEAFEGYAQLTALVESLRAEGLEVQELITSGTPAFRCALDYPGFQTPGSPVHRVSPGTVVFHDLRSELENPDLELVPAACLFSRVISHPSPGRVTLDAGSKSIAAEAGDPCAWVLGHPSWRALSPSEEHLPMDLGGAPQAPRGTSVLLVPMHICPTVNLAEEVLLIDGDELRVETVAARGHDLLEPGALQDLGS